MIGVREEPQPDKLEQFLALTEDDWISWQWRMDGQPSMLPFHDGTHYQVSGAGSVLLSEGLSIAEYHIQWYHHQTAERLFQACSHFAPAEVAISQFSDCNKAC